MTILLKWAFFEKNQTKNLLNCITAYTQIQMFPKNSDQSIDSNCNPGVSTFRLFGHAKGASICKPGMAGLKKLHPRTAAQKLSTRQCLRKPF